MTFRAPLSFLLLAWPASPVLQAQAPGADRAAWTHEQKVRVMQPGLTRLELEPALLAASRAAQGAPFHDLRLVSPTGVETPCIIAMPQLLRPARVTAASFKTTLHPGATVLQFRQTGADVIDEILLDTTAPEFIKAATVAASSDGVSWQTLTSGEVLTRQHGTERLRIPLEPATWTHFRVTLDDARTAPVVFDGARLNRVLPELRTVAQEVAIRARRDDNQQTRLTLDLGSANVLLASVGLVTPEPVFQREAQLLGSRRTLFRLKLDGHTGEELEVPVQQIARDREIELVIQNGDSPPLAIDRVTATRHALHLVFYADIPGQWRLYAGNAQAPEPRYDLAALSSQLQAMNAATATASAVERNTAFTKTATAPDTGDAEAGAVIDISTWARRRPIEFSEAGVVELELEPEVLAASTTDLHDLRVVREGRQVPFLTIKPGSQRETSVAFTELPQPDTPSRSVWEVPLPFRGFPASEVVLDTPTLLFARDLEVFELRKSEQGRAARTLGTSQWRRGPGQSVRPLVIGLYQPPQTDTIQIRTDNGDNPPLRLSAVRLLHPVVKLMFRVPDTKPTHLCYGNPRASYARYDLQLARKELEKATKVTATLGEEEKLPGFRDEPGSRGNGGPWVWGALAVVVGVLVWLVARLLPKVDNQG